MIKIHKNCKSWFDYLTNTQTFPVENYGISNYYLPISIEVKKLKFPNESLIDFHKRKLGKQTFTWIGFEGRSYIWKFDQFLLFVSKNKGFSIELLLPGSKEIALQAYSDYIKSMGVEKSLSELDIENYKYRKL